MFLKMKSMPWIGCFFWCIVAANSSPEAFAQEVASIHDQARKLESERKWSEAARLWETSKEVPSALYSAGLDWESAGENTNAERVYKVILNRFPESEQAVKSHFCLAMIAQKRNDFREMESQLLWYFHAPKGTIRRPEALCLLGGHYLVVRADRWAAYGCFEALRTDYPTSESLKMAVATWSQVENVGDLALWSSELARWRNSGLLPDRLPLFLLNGTEIASIRKSTTK